MLYENEEKYVPKLAKTTPLWQIQVFFKENIPY